MFIDEDFKNMTKEEREAAIEYMESYLDDIAVSNGDYRIEDEEIIIED
ncbi:hypothetical protein P4493_28820 [Bacillus thuringiensis]|jgi:hypothetical protein|uniref:Uncharacterized protein n=1 Tax=Bacillus thuringiensis subsp. israelensis TaxID=1430 RepID=A0AAX3HIY2_BACTI|nr:MULTISPECIES: hypothetical protein [Bacillus]AFU16384.1 hypothetical protein MC28_4962 [Bacillus thuringiensis MC28]MED1154893.1 hypothetical protein [Bacillus paranthracis]AJH08595.1 hypothetical protein AS86_3662 [Bacillus thuringiensis HD1002]AND22342.1 pseudouridine synthase [Bacillus thuringiensis serovar israelensis]EEM99245.1 hypothetical protein bthur0014_61200 [Bacillus thuringiensis IBL 4222]